MSEAFASEWDQRRLSASLLSFGRFRVLDSVRDPVKLTDERRRREGAVLAKRDGFAERAREGAGIEEGSDKGGLDTLSPEARSSQRKATTHACSLSSTSFIVPLGSERMTESPYFMRRVRWARRAS